MSLSTSEYVANESVESLTIEVIRTGNLFRCACAGEYYNNSTSSLRAFNDVFEGNYLLFLLLLYDLNAIFNTYASLTFIGQFQMIVSS